MYGRPTLLLRFGKDVTCLVSLLALVAGNDAAAVESYRRALRQSLAIGYDRVVVAASLAGLAAAVKVRCRAFRKSTVRLLPATSKQRRDASAGAKVRRIYGPEQIRATCGAS